VELSICARLRVASDRSETGLAELDLGLLHGWGGTACLSRLVGESVAMCVIFTGDRFSAERM
jgi:enoyl-CoA hydratase/3-hydroxyacyl-CoA dehydrogenase